jgi:hypothetical protein
VGGVTASRLIFMTVKTNHLRVRRIDLLEQLEERFASMTKEKEKYDQLMAKHELACEQYFKDVEEWESKIHGFLLERIKKQEPIYSHRTHRGYSRYSYDETWNLSIDISFNREELNAQMGPEPKKPEGPDTPSFLVVRYGYKHDRPSLYQAVYQAIQLLHLSDDEHVNASTYQLALEVL